jgi:hypothetical protein
MKIAIDAEDAIIGIICGLLLLGLTGTFFELELSNIVYAIAFAVFIIFIIFDVVNDLLYIASHFMVVILAMAHNAVDFVISAAFVSHFTGYDIPIITSSIVPYLQNEQVVMWAGLFLVVTNGLWLVTLPFWN